MTIRTAQERDIPALLNLLGQVLELHAAIRPDIFVPGTTKYSPRELSDLLGRRDAPIWVAVDGADRVLGYAFCQLRRQPFSNNMVPFSSIFVDDLCVDQQARGRGVGKALFQYVKEQAKAMGCYEVTLNVWEGNDAARAFYDSLGMRPKETQMELILEG